MRDQMKSTGEKLRELRRVIGQVERCTQADLAAMIGTSRSAIGHLEADDRPLTANYRRRIYRATGAQILNEHDYPVVVNERGEYERFEPRHYEKREKR